MPQKNKNKKSGKGFQMTEKNADTTILVLKTY